MPLAPPVMTQILPLSFILVSPRLLVESIFVPSTQVGPGTGRGRVGDGKRMESTGASD